MSAKDTIHDAVRNALVKDGWKITHDPYTIKYRGDVLKADLAAERLIAADRGPDRIAVEVKSFSGPSVLYDFEQAAGQFMLYRAVMTRVDPDRRLVLAVADRGYKAIQRKASAVLVIEVHHIPLLVVSLTTEEVIRWTS